MNGSKLFSDEETIDKSPTAFSSNDTHIQYMSKRFAKNTILEGEFQNLMIAYQQGAKELKAFVIKALCKDCQAKEECDVYEECDAYNNICEVFDK